MTAAFVAVAVLAAQLHGAHAGGLDLGSLGLFFAPVVVIAVLAMWSRRR